MTELKNTNTIFSQVQLVRIDRPSRHFTWQSRTSRLF